MDVEEITGNLTIDEYIAELEARELTRDEQLQVRSLKDTLKIAASILHPQA